MRFTIDTEIDRITVPDTFFNQIDKMNAVLKEHGGKGTEIIDYVQCVKEAVASAASVSRICLLILAGFSWYVLSGSCTG